MNEPGQSTSTETTAGRLAAMVAILTWSAGNVIVREVPMPGLQLAFWRIALGAVVYGLLLAFQGRRLTGRQLRAIAPAAIVIALEIALFFLAIKRTTIANATVIAALQPILLLGVAARRFGEVITRWLVGAVVVALLGVGLVIFGSSSQAVWSPTGDLLALVAVVFFAAYFLFAKTARETVPAFEFQTGLWLIGAVTLLPLALIDAGGLDVPSARNWAWLLLLLAVPGTGHFLMNWAHSRVRLSLTSILTLALPVLSTIGAAIFLSESVDLWQVVGMAVVVIVLVAVVRRDVTITAS